MTNQSRTVLRIAAPVIALITAVGALVVSAPSAPSATSPTPAAATGSPSPTASPPPSCGGTTLCPIKVDYYAPLDSTNPSDPTLCQQPYSSAILCHIDLRGLLYMPGNTKIGGSTKNNPLVIFVHGSTNNNGVPDTSAMASYFTKNKIAFFALHRRGHGDSTGQNLDGIPEDPTCATSAACDISTIDNLCKQVFEVKQAIIHLKTLRNNIGNAIIDPSRIAVLGHSLGGIVSLCANTHDLGQRTIIDIAAASESWKHYDLEDGVIDGHSPTIAALNQVVMDHVTPPMFLQPLNDCSTVPTDQFGTDIADQNELYEATLFPNVTVNTSPPYGPPISDCTVAHPNFVFKQYWVDKWGPSVKAWLDRMFAPADTINVAPVPTDTSTPGG